MEKIFLTPDVAKVIRGMPKIWDSFYIDRLGKKNMFSTASGNYVQGLGRLEDYTLQRVVEQGMRHYLNQGIVQQYMADALKKTGVGGHH